MSSLEKIGLSRESPTEIVLTTFSHGKMPHASVMGIKAMKGPMVTLRVFTDTETFRNIIQHGGAVINIIRDVRLLASIALRKFSPFRKISLKFEKSEHVNAPRLIGADAYLEIETTRVRKEKISDEIGTSEIANITAKVKKIEVTNPSPRPLKRSEFFLIESAILATRIKEALKRGNKKVAREKILELNEYIEKCRQIAPRSKELNLMIKIKGLFRNEMR